MSRFIVSINGVQDYRKMLKQKLSHLSNRIARITQPGRAVRLLLSLILVGGVLAGQVAFVASVSAANPPASAALTWADASPIDRYRNPGDWLVSMGRIKPEVAYGPFIGKSYKVGDSEQFFALDIDNYIPGRKITATLQLITDHAYWWFENGTDFSAADVQKAGQRFENDIYPLDTSLFGHEWNPGIDGDPHIFILNQKRIGGYAVGVFNRKDECATSLCPTSNQHEMIYVGLDFGPPNSPQQLTVIAHEFQHLIQFNNDGNKERWLDEGLAQLAEHLNGFDPSFIANSNLRDFLHNPNFQLDTWPEDGRTDPGVNYAVGYIFCVYLYQRFGTPFIQQLSRSHYKGLGAVDETLRALNTGVTLDQVFLDWAVTNYLNSPYVGDGRFSYQSLKLPQRAEGRDVSADSPITGTIDEYGADYLHIREGGTYTLSFKGDTTAKLGPAKQSPGRWMWWSFNEESGAARIDHAFDLTKAQNPQLTFNAAWEMQPQAGLANVLASADNGQHWTSLKATDTRSCRSVDTNCFNGQSHGWQHETVDLSQYQGQQVRIRFEYLTQGNPPSSSFFVDNIAIPAIGYTDNIETGDSGWERHGFMRATSDVPQHWGVSVISRDTPPRVLPITLDARNTGTARFTAPADGAVVVITAMAPFVQATPAYTVTLRQEP